MLRFTRQVNLLKFDADGYSRRLEKNIGQVFREATREMVRAAYQEVPVKTGHARGSLRPLGQFLRVHVPIEPREGEPDHIHKGEAEQMFELVDDKSDPGGQVFDIIWESFVQHYQLHEGKWQSVEAGKKAFDNYFNTFIVNKYPGVEEFLSNG